MTGNARARLRPILRCIQSLCALSLVLVSIGGTPEAATTAINGSTTPSRSAPPGFLMAEYVTGDILSGSASYDVTITSLAGKRASVPVRVRDYPMGLSPDGSLVAHPSFGEVELGLARGGWSKKIEIPGEPSISWSPNSRRLAVAASSRGGATLVRIFDRSGRAVRSFTLPRTIRGARVSYGLVAWSGPRLFLQRQKEPSDGTIVALNLRSGKLRTLVPLDDPHESARVSLSPNGRMLAAEVLAPWGLSYRVIDVASRRRIVSCTAASPAQCTRWLGLVWAPNSRGLFVASGTSIVRAGLTGRRVTVMAGRPGESAPVPLLASAGHLVYTTFERGRDTFMLLDLKTHQRTRLARSPDVFDLGLDWIVGLRRLP